MDLTNKINALGLKLPKAPKPAGVYRPILIVDNYLFVSGQGPLKSDGKLITGKVGKDLDREKGKLAARQVGLTMLSSIVSNLDPKIKIKRVIKVLGMVNATPEFKDHPYVINGFSELMVEIFDSDNGIGVRSAVGMSLTQNIALKIEAMFEIY